MLEILFCFIHFSSVHVIGDVMVSRFPSYHLTPHNLWSNPFCFLCQPLHRRSYWPEPRRILRHIRQVWISTVFGWWPVLPDWFIIRVVWLVDHLCCVIGWFPVFSDWLIGSDILLVDCSCCVIGFLPLLSEKLLDCVVWLVDRWCFLIGWRTIYRLELNYCSFAAVAEHH